MSFDELDSQNYENDEELKKAKSIAVGMMMSKTCSAFMIKKKLCEKNYGAYADYVCDYYEKLGYFSDEKFCEAYIKDAYNIKKYGPFRIIANLRKFGIKNEIIDQCFLNLDLDFHALMEQIILSKINKFDISLPKQKKKMADYLIRRGFDSSDVFSILRKYSR